MTSHRLNNFDALLFAMALEVSLQQMGIVESCAALKTHSKHDITNNPDLQLREKKMQSDRLFVTTLIRSLLIEMAESGSWINLQTAVDAMTQHQTEAVELRQKYEDLLNTREKLKRELKLLKLQHRYELRTLNYKITSLRDSIEDVKLNSKFRLVYANKWLNSQAQSLEIRHDVERPQLPSEDNEKRVHSDIIKLYNMQIEDMENEIVRWRLKYADDTADINIRLAMKREQLQESIARHQELEETYNLHAGEMRSWLNFKRQRAERLAREEKARLSATRLQAWWRGVMVRRGIGCFKHLRNKNSAKKSPNPKNKKR